MLVHPDRNGHMYVMDRRTGELLSVKPFTYTNTIKYVDLKTGVPMMNDEKRPHMGQKVVDICPAARTGVRLLIPTALG